MDGRRQRAVIILHPDFDRQGAAGVREAKEFAEQLMQGQAQMIEAAEKSGEDPKKIKKIRKHAAQFQFLVRNLPEDLL